MPSEKIEQPSQKTDVSVFAKKALLGGAALMALTTAVLTGCDGAGVGKLNYAKSNLSASVATAIPVINTTDEMARSADGRLGFAFTYFWYDVLETPKDCPAGYAMALRDLAIADFPKEKQEFLLMPENRSTYYRLGYALTAKRYVEQNGTSICNIPTTYQDPPHRTVQSGTAFGRNLDGENSTGGQSNSCGASDFTSPDGRTGIDNQLYRVMGCIDSYRRNVEFAGGAMEDYHVGAYRDGEITTLMDVRGVDDLVNDDHVEIGIYSSHEATPFDTNKKGIEMASLTVTDNTLWHNVGTGRIENGVLISDPFELRLKFGWAGRPAEYLIKDTQLHLKINKDGTLSGDLVGFFDLQHAYWSNFHDERGALQVANGFTCPAVWKSLKEHADGYPDPKTGQCGAISTAMRMEAMPAFIVHPPKEKLTKYFLDTREYYGVSMEKIAVEGAVPRKPEGASGPPSSVTIKKKKKANLEASDGKDQSGKKVAGEYKEKGVEQ